MEIGPSPCLSVCPTGRHGINVSVLQSMEIGPSLGMVKSSSLESLHNVMHHTIKRDVVDDGSELRNRSTRNSFKRAVDHSYEAGEEGGGAIARGKSRHGSMDQ